MQFTKATKRQAKGRVALAGPAGAGKTYTALTLATHLNAGAIAVLDTEHGSASKYADLFSFDVLDLASPFHPDRFCQAIKAAADAGYGVLVIDSLSHAWSGKGGLLEIVDDEVARSRSGNSFAAWKVATPIQLRLVEAILAAPMHVIATMRSKQEYIIEQVERNGRTVSQPRKLGMAPVQRDGMEFEFDIFADLDVDNTLIVSKTRCSALTGAVIKKPGQQMADTIRQWLDSGAEPAPPPKPPEYDTVGSELVHTPTGAVVTDPSKRIASEADIQRLRNVLLELNEPVMKARLTKEEKADAVKAGKLTVKDSPLERDILEAFSAMVSLLAKLMHPDDFTKQVEFSDNMLLETV